MNSPHRLRAWRLGTGVLAAVGVLFFVARRNKPAWAGPERKPVVAQVRSSAAPSVAQPAPASAAPLAFDELVRGLRSDAAPRLLAFLGTLEPGDERTAVAAQLLRQWARENPAAAIDYIIRDAQTGNSLLTGLLSESLHEQTPSELALDSSQEALPAVLAALFAHWATQSPEAAALHALRLESAQHRKLISQVVMEKWARTDLAGAVAWVKTVPEGPERAAMLSCLARPWAGSDPGSAAMFAATLPEGPERAKFLIGVAAAWAAKDPAAAVAWVDRLPDSPTRAAAVRSALATLLEHEPAAAADALRQLTNGAAVRDAAQLVMPWWAARDLDAAVRWFDTLPRGALREHVLHALADAWVPRDPARVIGAAAKIADPVARVNELEHVVRVWLERDATAARAWLARADVPAELRTRFGW